MRYMKQMKLLALASLLATTAVPALADHRDRDIDQYEDMARVISVQPQIERVNTPRQECRTEYVRESYYESRDRSNTGAVIGGVTGGLLGSTIGRGSGRVAAAAVGAGVGAIVGDRMDNDRRYGGRERVETRPVERCVTVDNWHTETRGYLVTYEYNGRSYNTMTEQHPGNRIPVMVTVNSPRNYVSNVTYMVPGRGRGWDDDHPGRGYGRRKHDRHYW